MLSFGSAATASLFIFPALMKRLPSFGVGSSNCGSISAMTVLGSSGGLRLIPCYRRYDAACNVRDGVSGPLRGQGPRGSRFAPHRKLCPAHKLAREEFLRLLV